MDKQVTDRFLKLQRPEQASILFQLNVLPNIHTLPATQVQIKSLLNLVEKLKLSEKFTELVNATEG